jgi:hypothetical protein
MPIKESVANLKAQNGQLAQALHDLASYVRRCGCDEFQSRDGGYVERWKSRQLLDLLNKAEALLPKRDISRAAPNSWQPVRTAPKADSAGAPIVLEAVLLDETPREQRIWWRPGEEGGVWISQTGKVVRPAFWRPLASDGGKDRPPQPAGSV